MARIKSVNMAGWIPWVLAAAASAAAVGLCFYWRRRWARADSELGRRETEIVRLREACSQPLSPENLKRQQPLFDSMAEGVLIADLDKRILLVNRGFLQLAGLTTAPIGKSILEALRRHELPELLDRVRTEGNISGVELELSQLEPRHIEMSAAAIMDPARRLEGFLVLFHDLTQLKNLESIRTDFVANVSHELRTPLTMIKGYVETLLDGQASTPEMRAKFLKVIERHTDRLIFLIEDLLTISQLESGRVALNRKRFCLREVGQRVLDDLAPRAHERQTSLVNEIAAEILVEADSDRIQQVLWNLVDNAIKYGKLNGSVRLSSEVLTAEALVRVKVQDEGQGIPAESQARVFERFYRVDRARSREAGGTGLGLSIVKHIVQAHGGSVWVESTPGLGSSFYFTLPRHDA